MLQVFNTLTQKKEVFEPIEAGKVRMYVCGITVYDDCHLGHARMLLAFDVIARWLRSSGYDVTYVRNITDVDDKILRRAAELNEDFTHLTERFIQKLHDDERTLGIQPPDIEPRATQYIDQIIAMIQTLIDKGYAYAAENGDVYYSVTAFPEYGKLSRKKLDELLAGARVEVDEIKKDPRDFALWKGAKLGESARWDAPWGAGRPGWHIECSAMATANLGDSFDIHGGGTDLIFPHHENEIAQAEAATGCHFAKYWLHNGPIRVGQEKMSKSLGNFFTIREVLEKYPAEVVRYFLIASHYRTPIDYTDKEVQTESETSLQIAHNDLNSIYLSLRGVPRKTSSKKYNNEYSERFTAAMNDDFNTAEAFAVLFQIANAINTCKAAGDKEKAASLAAQLRQLAEPLGVLQLDAEEFLKTAVKESSVLESDATDEQIERLVQQRIDAKKTKNYALADKIRKDLEYKGIVLEDSREGTTWRKTRREPLKIPLPETAKFWVESKGCTFAYDSLYVSNLEEKNLQESVNYLSEWMGDTTFVQLVQFPEETLDFEPQISHFFDGNFSLAAVNKKYSLRGQYLRVIWAYEHEKQIEYVKQFITNAVNLLRIKYGYGAAIECAKSTVWNLVNRQRTYTSNEILVTTHGNGREGNEFYEHGATSGVTSIENITLKSEASILLDEALNSNSKYHRFLFLWMALEAQIGGRGKEREKFCKVELNSEKISDEMERLHKIRSGYVHNFEKVSQEMRPTDSFVLMELLRLSTLQDGPERKKLVKIVEDLITKNQAK